MVGAKRQPPNLFSNGGAAYSPERMIAVRSKWVLNTVVKRPRSPDRHESMRWLCFVRPKSGLRR